MGMFLLEINRGGVVMNVTTVKTMGMLLPENNQGGVVMKQCLGKQLFVMSEDNMGKQVVLLLGINWGWCVDCITDIRRDCLF